MGKSSLLNSLKRTRVAQVGNTPGVTKAVQEVVLDKHLRLLDSPGIVFADNDSSTADAASQALRNCIKVSQMCNWRSLGNLEPMCCNERRTQPEAAHIAAIS